MKLIKVKDYNNLIHYINPAMIVDVVLKQNPCRTLAIKTVNDQVISVFESNIDKTLNEILNA